MKNIFLFGATGSIGSSTLKVLEKFPDRFTLVGVSCYRNLDKLLEIVKRFRPKFVVLGEKEQVSEFKSRLDYSPEVLWGDEGLKVGAEINEVDIAVIGISGIKGLIPAYYALKAGKRIAIANKESLIVAGHLIKKAQASGRGEVIPVDSEHSSIFQLLHGKKQEVRHIILTASGGPFYKLPIEEFSKITPEQAVAHPNWKMGAKISVDSATLMNKGFEVLEASVLFELPVQRIKILIHPQSIVHGIVELLDGSVFMHASVPDMRIAICYALSYPERLDCGVKPLSLSEVKNLVFEEPDFEKFPCLRIAYEVGKTRGIYPLILEAADEVIVDAFLNRKIRFDKISYFLEKTLNEFKIGDYHGEDIEEILKIHEEVRRFTEKIIKEDAH